MEAPVAMALVELVVPYVHAVYFPIRILKNTAGQTVADESIYAEYQYLQSVPPKNLLSRLWVATNVRASISSFRLKLQGQEAQDAPSGLDLQGVRRDYRPGRPACGAPIRQGLPDEKLLSVEKGKGARIRMGDRPRQIVDLVGALATSR